MWRRRLDLPLDQDAGSRSLALIIMVMVFLAILALTAANTLATMAQRWNQGLSGAITVQIMPQPELADSGSGSSRASGEVAPLSARVELAAALLRATPGVARVEPVAADDTSRLLEPWLGSHLPADLPLPGLVEAQLRPGMVINLPALAQRLAAAVPGATVDDHSAWLGELRTLARLVQGLALAIVALIGGAAVLAVMFAVRAGLALHQPVIELLHIMGATDAYVSLQFEAHVLRLALQGCLGGLALAGGVLVLAHQGAARLTEAAVPLPEFGWADGLILLLVPSLACACAVTTTRWLVRRALAAMP